MKKITITLLALFFIIISQAQLRVAIVGGAHQSTVIEENDLPNWDSLKNNYAGRGGAHFGFIADLPFAPKSHLYFQGGVLYYNRGRKYLEHFDTTGGGNIINKSATQYINYIDMPLNIVVKFGRKAKFIIGGGPYASFFYNGKESSQTISTTGISASTKNDDVPVGKKPGQYRIFNYGVNGLAGLEIGRVMLTANYTRGLSDFYQAINYTGTFRHQTIGGTLGIFLDKHKEPEKKIKDKDGDGIADKDDSCPGETGTAATQGCPDKDADGIADKDDKCPGIAGTLKNNGCPVLDKDDDGVTDTEDKCPDVKGTKENNGCPVTDTDKDGINDDQDKCPSVFGYSRYEGCPVPDTDKDGINDEEDRCPDVKGTKENNGCPNVKKEIVEKVNYAAKRIQFQYRKADILPESHKVLDEVVKILNDNPELKLLIEGHTSGDGIFEANMKLSQSRANNVRAYFLSKGIDASRITAKGFGSTKLINNGTSESAKSQNRRVEMKISNQ